MTITRYALFCIVTLLHSGLSLANQQQPVFVIQNQSGWGIKKLLVCSAVGYVGYKLWRYNQGKLTRIEEQLALAQARIQQLGANQETINNNLGIADKNSNANHKITHTKLGAESARPTPLTSLQPLPTSVSTKASASLETISNYLTWFWHDVLWV